MNMTRAKVGFDELPEETQKELEKGNYVNVFLCQPSITLSGVYQRREGGELILANVFEVQFNEDGTREIRVSNYPQRIPLQNVSSYVQTTEQDYLGRLERHRQDMTLEEMQREVHGRELQEKLTRLRNSQVQEFS